MGFRSVMVSSLLPIVLPEEFWVKHFYLVRCNDNSDRHSYMATRWEIKTYGECLPGGSDTATEIENDIQEMLVKSNRVSSVHLVWLHDCDGVTRVKITSKDIVREVPAYWIEDGSMHDGHDCVVHCAGNELH